jgi:hypothetical protein
MALASVEAVRAEGNFLPEQLTKTTDEELDAVLSARIDEASAEVLRRVGDDLYATEEPGLRQLLTTAEVYLATSKTLQTIANIVATWDAEALPAEFIDSRELAAIIVRYRTSAEQLLAPYERGVREGARPYLGARSISA